MSVDGTFLRAVALCVTAAMLCALLRTQRPELAMALSLAAGAAVTALLAQGMSGAMDGLARLWRRFDGDDALLHGLVRAGGVAVISELGAQLCVDAGERALAGRIGLAARVAMLGVCAPLLLEAAERVAGLLS